MDESIESCERILTEHLRNVNSLKAALEAALAEIRRVKENVPAVPVNVSPQQLLQQILMSSLESHTHATPDLIAGSRRSYSAMSLTQLGSEQPVFETSVGNLENSLRSDACTDMPVRLDDRCSSKVGADIDELPSLHAGVKVNPSTLLDETSALSSEPVSRNSGCVNPVAETPLPNGSLEGTRSFVENEGGTSKGDYPAGADNLSGDADSKQMSAASENVLSRLMRTSGPKIGVRYKIEVTSPLGSDGSFWACPVEPNYMDTKVEPLAAIMKQATHKNPHLWKVDDLSTTVCVMSGTYGLFMRGVVEKQLGDQTVRVRYVDVGRTEDVVKGRLNSIPEALQRIPFMAFHCMLFDKKVELKYEAKWMFNDLVSKQVVYFTCERKIEVDGQSYVCGKVETILDPQVNVGEKVWLAAKDRLPPDEHFEAVLVSRDIRALDFEHQRPDFQCVAGVVTKESTDDGVGEASCSSRYDSKPRQDQGESQRSKIMTFFDGQQTANSTTHQRTPVPLRIPTEEELRLAPSWGESKTPSGEDEELELGPVDESLFGDCHESEMFSRLEQEGERIWREDIAGTSDFDQQVPIGVSSLVANPLQNTSDVQAQCPPFGFAPGDQMEAELHNTISMIADEESAMVRFAEHTQMSDADYLEFQTRLKNVRDCGRQLVSQQKIFQTQSETMKPADAPGRIPSFRPSDTVPPGFNIRQRNASLASPGYSALPAPSLDPKYRQRMFSPDLSGIVPQVNLSSESTQARNGETPKFYPPVPAPEHRRFVSNPDAAPGYSFSDSRVHHASCDAIFEGNSLAGDRNMGVYEDYYNPKFVGQTQQLALKREQEEWMLQHRRTSQDQSSLQQSSSSAQKYLRHRSQEEDSEQLQMQENPKHALMLQQMQVQQQQRQQELQRMQQHAQVPRFYHSLQYDGDFKSQVTQRQEDMGLAVLQRKVSSDGKTAFSDCASMNLPIGTPAVSSAMLGRGSAYSKSPADLRSGRASIGTSSGRTEGRHFAWVPLERLMTEAPEDWLSREIINLTHPLLEDPSARFFIQTVSESDEGKHFKFLEASYRKQFCQLDRLDADRMKIQWEATKGKPLFLFLRLQPRSKSATHRIISLLEVCSEIQQGMRGAQGVNFVPVYCCEVRWVSTAVVGLTWSLQWDANKEIPSEKAREFIREVLREIQSGRAERLFCGRKVMGHSDAEVINSRKREVTQDFSSHMDRQRLLYRFPSEHENWENENDEARYRLDSAEMLTSELKQSLMDGDRYNIGSDDDGERDICAEIEAFGLSNDDLL